MRVRQVTDCMDLLAGFELMDSSEQKQVFLLAIDTLCGYPKPQRRGDSLTAQPEKLGTYLFISNTRNACKLGELELISPIEAHRIAMNNLTNALTLLQA
jgi:hypothetical protein